MISISSMIFFENSTPSTYDHRTLKTRLPVRSAIYKQCTGGLVVRWVTTSESPLLYVMFLFCCLPASSPPNTRKVLRYFVPRYDASNIPNMQVVLSLYPVFSIQLCQGTRKTNSGLPRHVNGR